MSLFYPTYNIFFRYHDEHFRLVKLQLIHLLYLDLQSININYLRLILLITTFE